MIISEKVQRGDLEIQGALYDLDSGQVHFMGRSPLQQEITSNSLFGRLAGS